MFGEPGVGVGLMPSGLNSTEPIMASSLKERNSVMMVTYAKTFKNEKHSII